MEYKEEFDDYRETPVKEMEMFVNRKKMMKWQYLKELSLLKMILFFYSLWFLMLMVYIPLEYQMMNKYILNMKYLRKI